MGGGWHVLSLRSEIEHAFYKHLSQDALVMGEVCLKAGTTLQQTGALSVLTHTPDPHGSHTEGVQMPLGAVRQLALCDHAHSSCPVTPC